MSVLSHFSHVRLFVTLWTLASEDLLSTGFSREEYWSGLPCPFPGDPPDPGVKPVSLMSPELAGRFLTTSATDYDYNLKNKCRGNGLSFKWRCLLLKLSSTNKVAKIDNDNKTQQ